MFTALAIFFSFVVTSDLKIVLFCQLLFQWLMPFLFAARTFIGSCQKLLYALFMKCCFLARFTNNSLCQSEKKQRKRKYILAYFGYEI